MNEKLSNWFPSLGFIILIYFFANILMVMNQGVYWDDWVLYNTSEAAIKKQFYGNGLFYLSYLHIFLNGFKNPVMVYNTLTFIFELVTIFSIYQSLKMINLKKDFIGWFILFFAVLPFFSAKNTMICLPYILHLSFFYVGFYIMIQSKISKSIILRILSLIFFFISFPINSLIPFYVLPLIISFFVDKGFNLLQFKDIIKNNKKDFFNFAIKNIDYYLLPCIFYLFKKKFFTTTGLYQQNGYNDFDLKELLISCVQVFKVFKTSLLALFKKIQVLFASPLHLILFGIIFLVIVIFIRYSSFKKVKFETLPKEYYIHILTLGIITFLLGAFPYIVVNKTPSFGGYETRHQLLLNPGASLIIVGITFIIVNRKFVNYIFIFLISCFLLINNSINLQYIKGWFKQESLISKFSMEKKINSSDTFIFIDHSKGDNATSRDYAFYNLNGIIKKGLNRQDKLIVDYEEFNKINWKDIIKEAEMYNMKNYVFRNFDNPLYVKVDRGRIKLSSINTLKLLFKYYTSRHQFNTSITNITDMEFLQIETAEADFFLKNEN